jgi:sulfur carrier protein ThiS
MSTLSRRIIIALVAAVAVSAVAAASASAAAPEFKLSATGKFPVPLTSTSKTAKLLTGVAGRKVECGASTSTGEIGGAKELKKIVVKFTKCKAEAPIIKTAPCKSGTTSEEIVPVTAKGLLVFGLMGTTKVTSVDLEPEAAGNFASFTCEALGKKETITVKGSVICPITPTGKLQTTSKLECSEEATGKQSLREYENSSGATVKDLLETEGSGNEPFAAEPSAEVVTAEQLTTEPVEIT